MPYSAAIRANSLEAAARPERRRTIPERLRDENVLLFSSQHSRLDDVSEENSFTQQGDAEDDSINTFDGAEHDVEDDIHISGVNNEIPEEGQPNVADDQTEAGVTDNNPMKWGSMKTEGEISRKLNRLYENAISWHKNFFDIPRGASGQDMIRKVTTLLQLFNNDTAWKNISLKAIHVFIPYMLQKPSAKSKNKDHLKYLVKRLEWWKKDNWMNCLKRGMRFKGR